MSLLAQAKKPVSGPPIITIIASPGAGKTSLAGTFPDVIFIQAEDASTVFENWDDDVKPAMLPVLPKSAKDAAGNITVSTKNEIMTQLRALATEEHDYKTVVIDGLTSLNSKFEAEIALRDNVTNVADAAGGFHKGYVEIAQWHYDIMYACEVLKRRKGMAIVFLAHLGTQKIKNSPDESAEYCVYGMEMHPKSSAVYINNSDMVGYIKKEAFITGTTTDKKGQVTKYGRAMQTGERILITNGDGQTGYIAAKNRYGMPNEIPLPFGENPLKQYIKHFSK